MISVPNRVYAEEYGTDIPVTIDFTPLPTDMYWRLELAEPTSEMKVTDSGYGGNVTKDNVYWRPADLIGAHRLTGTLELTTYDQDYNESTTTQNVTLNTTVIRQKTAATIKASNTKPMAGSTIRIKGCITVGGKRQTWRDFAVQVRFPGGNWRKHSADYTDSLGCYDMPMTVPKAGTRHVRVHVPPLHWAERAYTKTVSVKARK